MVAHCNLAKATIPSIFLFIYEIGTVFVLGINLKFYYKLTRSESFAKT